MHLGGQGQACKGLSKKKTKGVRGKSPFAVCVKAAAKLMAGKAVSGGGGGNGAADTRSGDSGSGDSPGSTADGSSADDGSDPICRDA